MPQSADAARRPGAAEIRAWIVDLLTDEFGVEPEAVQGASRLADLGLDSVEALGVANALERWLDRDLPKTLLMELPDLDSLVRHLAGDSAPPPAPEPAQAAGAADRYGRFVNPYMADRLEKLRYDKRFTRARGCEIWDEDGRHYLDFVGSFGALPFGHNPPEIWRALHELSADLEPTMVQPAVSDSATRAAERLAALAPGDLRYVTFANSGTEAIELAIKLCRAATGRPGILSTRNAFHGKTLAALSATGNPYYQTPFGAPLPDFDTIAYGDLAALRAALDARPGFHAAFVVEPIQGEGGVVEPPPGYLAQAQRLCRDAGVLLVADEIQTGLGRTGAWFASQQEGLEPDVMALAKALGGGLVPIGAVLATPQAYPRAVGERHSSTFAGNAVACRAALAALDALERDEGALLRHVAECGARLRAGLDGLARRHARIVAEARGRGFLLGLRLRSDRDAWPSRLLGLAAEQDMATSLLSSYLLNVDGVRLAPTLNGSDVLRIEPPLIATWEQCETVLRALDEALAVFESGDSGRVLGGILDAAPRPGRRGPVPTARVAAHRAGPGDARFAFVAHPGSFDEYVHFDPSLDSLGAEELEDVGRRLSGLVEPFLASRMRIASPAGVGAYGELFLVGRSADELMAMPPRQAVEEIREAVERARTSGAEIVGLGGFTSIVTGCGLDLGDAGVSLTTGNSYTVVSGCESVELALRALGRGLEDATVAVVGAPGAIGRGVAMLLAERASRLVLIGNPQRSVEHSRRRLERVAADVCGHLVSQRRRGRALAPDGLAARLQAREHGGDAPPEAGAAALARRLEDEGRLVLTCDAPSVLPSADVVVTATSAVQVLVEPEHLKRGAVVCDLSRPRNASPKIPGARPDVLLIDGGVVEIPGRPFIGDLGLEDGFTFACMAETMMLALEREGRSRSLGADLSLDDILHVRALAARHGFRVTRLTRQDRPLQEADWSRLRAARADGS